MRAVLRPDDPPVTDGEFARFMARLGPFEPRPELGVAVSGGPDSLALCLLARRWAADRAGRAVAFTVDHRLRPDSAAEARTVGAWLAAHGIPHRVLVWEAPPAAGPIQAAARTARYRLLETACAGHGILHLLLGHTLDDQAETLLLRLARGSGVDGLAAMARLRESAGLRVLRPLLGVPKARLRATCAAAGQTWIEDPSNASDRFARSRLRRAALAGLAAEGLTPERLADAARRAGRAREALELATAERLGRAAALYPEGHVLADRAALLAPPVELALRALARCLITVGGGLYPPRLERLERLHAALTADHGGGAGRTLAGCLILPRGAGGRRLLICREPRAAAECLPAAPGAALWWDGRFRVAIPRTLAEPAGPGLEVRRLGGAGPAALAGAFAPAAVLPALPGVWAGEELRAVPQIDARRTTVTSASIAVMSVSFEPRRPLTAPAFAVV